MKHEDYMKEAIRLSAKYMKLNHGGPFGAVIVKHDRIIGRGWNQVTKNNDPTAHAEIMAIRKACKSLESFNLKGSTIYTSCEPCPMCLSAIYWARIDRIYFANTRKDAAKINFDDALIYSEIAKPIAKRKIISQPLLRLHAQKIFKSWQEKPDKTPY